MFLSSMLVNLVKGLTGLTGLTDLAQSGELAHTRQMTVKQEHSVGMAHKIGQTASGFVNLVKGLTRLTGLPTEAVFFCVAATVAVVGGSASEHSAYDAIHSAS